jgi:hypothetical protein
LRLKQYISGKRALNLALFLFLMGTAYLFDVYHDDRQEFRIETETRNHPEQVMVYFCNPLTNITLKAPGQKVSFRSLLQTDRSRFITLLHSLRAFHLLKAEMPELNDHLLIRNLVALRNYHHSDPDDLPPSA